MSKDILFKSTIVLVLSGIVAKVIGAVYRIPLTWILGTEGLGIYQLVFPLFALLLVLSSTGAPTAISTMVSERVSKGEFESAKQVFKVSTKALFAFSVILSVLLCLLSFPISSLQGNSHAFICYIFIAAAIPFVALLSGFRGFFQGMLNMLPTALSQIIEQLSKLVLGLLFSFLFIKSGVLFGALGAILGVVLSEICAVLFMVFYWMSYKKKEHNWQNYSQNITIETNKQIFKQFIKNAVPIVACSLVLPLLLVADSLVVVPFLGVSGIMNTEATQMWGIYSGVVNSLINLPVALTLGVAVSVAPSLRKNLNSKEQVLSNITDSFSICFNLVLPCSVVLGVLAGSIIPFLYGEGMELAINLLRINSIFVVFIAFVQTQNAVLQGINKLFVPLVNMIIAGVCKILLLLLCLVPSVNIFGVLVSNVAFYVIMFVLNSVYLRKKIGFVVDFKRFVPCLISSIVLGLFIFVGTLAFQKLNI